MKFNLDRRFVLKTDTEYKSLYSWAINELDNNGQPKKSDQIPWQWSFRFKAETCTVINQFRLDKPFGWRSTSDEEGAKPTIIEVIRVDLKPAAWGNGPDRGPSFSMFGTDRRIKEFQLEIRPITEEGGSEKCHAWGSVSYNFDNDFHDETTADCLIFYLYIKIDLFERYVALAQTGDMHSIYFVVGGVDGFYSEWSPSISTDAVKVLLPGDEHKLEQAEGFTGTIPRLGKVNEAQLFINQMQNFVANDKSDKDVKDDPPFQPVSHTYDREEDDPVRPADPPQITVNLTTIQPLLLSIKRAAWTIVVLLAVSAWIALAKL